MGATLDSVATAGNRKGQPNYPKEFKQRIAMAACEPGISVGKLAMAHQLNANMVFRWRRHRLRTGGCYLLADRHGQASRYRSRSLTV